MEDFRVLQDELAHAVRHPEQASQFDDRPDRIAVYRRLVFNNFYGLLSGGFCDLLEAVGTKRFREFVRNFIQSGVSTTPYFAQISAEFCDWLQTQEVALWVKDLARYERAGISIDIDDVDAPVVNQAFSAQSELVFCPAIALMDFQYRIFDLPEGHEPAPQACWVLLYRNPHNRLRYKELNALSFVLLGHLMHGTTLQETAQILADQTGLEAKQLMDNGMVLLQELQREGAMLGGNLAS